MPIGVVIGRGTTTAWKTSKSTSPASTRPAPSSIASTADQLCVKAKDAPEGAGASVRLEAGSAQDALVSWPRMTPPPWSVEWKFTYQPAGFAMTCEMIAASPVTVRVNVTPPAVSVRSPALRPVSMRTGPFTPTAPSWMCPMLIAVVAGHPVMTTSNFTLVPLNVTVALPAHDASASVIGGFSFELLSSALNVGAGVGVGDGLAVGLGDGLRLGLGAAAVPPHAARTSVKLAIPASRRMATSFSSRTGIRQ